MVGLIGMLARGGSIHFFLKTLPIALTSTLYGVVFANFLFMPLASNVRERTDRELLLQKIIMEGTMAIATELNPRAGDETQILSYPVAKEGTGGLPQAVPGEVQDQSRGNPLALIATVGH